jgi:hypothetical protein
MRGLSYQWTTKNRLRLLHRLACGFSYKNGDTCIFIPLTGHVGVKIFLQMRVRRAFLFSRSAKPRISEFSLFLVCFTPGG